MSTNEAEQHESSPTQPQADQTAAVDAPPAARVTIKTLTFSGGDKFDMAENGVLVIVGPNNAGKSAALLNILHSLTLAATTPDICRPEFEMVGSWDDLEAQLRPHLKPDRGVDPHYAGPQFDFHGPSARNWWTKKKGLNVLGGYFALLLDTASRLSACNAVPCHAVGRVNAANAFQVLYEDPELQQRVSDVFKVVFDTGLAFNPLPGSEISLHVGEQPTPAKGEAVNSKPYLRKVLGLPRLDQQGDGMKSFAAMLLAVKVFPRQIMLIDEPEAFLHPPQERRIGKVLAEERPKTSQVVVATHSEDVIQGLLASAPKRVSIVRLTREGSVNHAKLLPNEKVVNLWKSPILRYSNILSGLFHEGVVITESDGDCRFFDAVQEVLPTSARKPDLFYTHGGGKDRMPR